MKQYIKTDEWNIIEEGFVPHYNKISESIFSLGNGRMGQRANFEEAYSGETLQGNYVAGVYYPDKTRVGWWKNGYPEYFAKVLNAANWIGIDIRIGDEVLDLHHAKVSSFRRVLNMKEGYLERSFTATMSSGKEVRVTATRFYSIADDEACAIRYSITPLNFDSEAVITGYIDGDIRNQDANYDEKFWESVYSHAEGNSAYLVLRTRKTGFDVCTGQQLFILQGGQPVQVQPVQREKYVGGSAVVTLRRNQETIIFKYAANLSSENHAREALAAHCRLVLDRSAAKGFDSMLKEQAAAWA
ncbi:MAG TPA: hypothetical protein VJ720_00085, partial [Chitinophaga sp.]|nr:hypothetical protein [Chitinophaga sp.]